MDLLMDYDNKIFNLKDESIDEDALQKEIDKLFETHYPQK